jgi:prepilin-type N-terminal cleavage/methylation domain-containing protein
MAKYFTFFLEKKIDNKGFTLIEMLLVVIILSILIVTLFGILNPLTQLNKANDTKREHDLTQIKNALDTYYNDTGCYPTTIPFSIIWKVNQTTYMTKVPEDDRCLKDGKCYLYQTDNSSCPQWNVLYGSLQVPNTSSNKVLCSLSLMTNCTPQGFLASGYNYCVISGNPDCSFVSSNELPPSNIASVDTPTPVQVLPTTTPTPTISCTLKAFKCTSFSTEDPLGVCQNVGSGGDYCGTPCQLHQIPQSNVCCDSKCTR